MSHQMPPGQIMMLIEIHCFVFQDQITMDNNSPASRKFYERLLREELIEVDPSHVAPRDEIERLRSPFKTTVRGQVLIEKWCETPLPVLVETWT